MSTGPTTTVGTATVTAASGLLTTAAAHGLVDGQLVYTASPTLGAIGVLVPNAPYWVALVSTSTFRLRPSPGGPTMVFTSDGEVTVKLAGAEYADDELRRLDLPLMWPGATGATTVSGIRPGNPAVSLAGYNVTFGPCAGITSVTSAPWTAISGPYRWMLTTDSTQSIAPADPSQVRVDRLVARIQDTTVDSLGFRHAIGAIKTGTPGQPAPAIDPGEVDLGTVQIGVNGSPAPALTLALADLTALGGTKPVANFASLPTVGRYRGMRCYLIDEATEVVWTGSTWERFASAASYGATRRIATSTRIGNSAGFSSEAVIQTISAVPVVSGRTYRIRWVADVASTAASSTAVESARWRIRDTNLAGAVLQYTHTAIAMANNDFGAVVETEWVAPSTTTKTFVGTCHRAFGSGTFSCNANANEPSILSVDQVLG
jgi:hypothetical protein